MQFALTPGTPGESVDGVAGREGVSNDGPVGWVPAR